MQLSYSPIYAKAQALQILDRPFASALARAGVITTGSGVMNMVFGDNVVEAFKQAGVYGVLSLLAESPHLAGTTIARGVAAHVNNLRAQRMVNAGILDQAPDNIAVKGPVGNWPVIDPDSPDVASQAHDAAVAMAKDVPGIDKPQIASATIRLIDGTERTYIGAEIHGTSHEEALEKIGKKKAPEGEEINIPEFKGTEDAIKFGESNKDNPAVLQEMHKRLDELRAKNKDMNERYADLSVDEEKALAGNRYV